MSEQPASPPGVPQWDVADRITKALRHGSVTTGEMAQYLGVSRQTVGNWTHGRFEPSIQSMRLIALRCGVSYSWLRTGKADAQSDGPTPGPGIRAGQDGRVLTYIASRKCTAKAPGIPHRDGVGERGPFPGRIAA